MLCKMSNMYPDFKAKQSIDVHFVIVDQMNSIDYLGVPDVGYVGTMIP